jgi:hypothetical protein
MSRSVKCFLQKSFNFKKDHGNIITYKKPVSFDCNKTFAAYVASGAKISVSVSSCEVPSSLLISSGAINFVTPTANFCLHLLGLFYQISKNFKNILSFKYFFLLMLLYVKKWLVWCFLKISSLLDFVTKLILKTQNNVPKNTIKELTYRTAVHMKYSSKF